MSISGNNLSYILAPSGYGDRLLIIVFQKSAGTKGYTGAKIRVKLHFLGFILQNAYANFLCSIDLYAVGINIM